MIPDFFLLLLRFAATFFRLGAVGRIEGVADLIANDDASARLRLAVVDQTRAGATPDGARFQIHAHAMLLHK